MLFTEIHPHVQWRMYFYQYFKNKNVDVKFKFSAHDAILE